MFHIHTAMLTHRWEARKQPGTKEEWNISIAWWYHPGFLLLLSSNQPPFTHHSHNVPNPANPVNPQMPVTQPAAIPMTERMRSILAKFNCSSMGWNISLPPRSFSPGAAAGWPISAIGSAIMVENNYTLLMMLLLAGAGETATKEDSELGVMSLAMGAWFGLGGKIASYLAPLTQPTPYSHVPDLTIRDERLRRFQPWPSCPFSPLRRSGSTTPSGQHRSLHPLDRGTEQIPTGDNLS